jgi:copper chaperone CopZ
MRSWQDMAGDEILSRYRCNRMPLMKRLILIAAMACLAGEIGAAEKKPDLAHRTFYISGLECASCVYMAQQAIAETQGVERVDVVQMLDSFAKVAYDPKALSEHQIAQAVREAPPLHGMPYLASLKVRVADYAKEGNATKVQALFERWKKWLEVVVMDEREGELVIHFLPLAKAAETQGPQGWSLAMLDQALSSPPPAGLGLPYEVVKQDEP